MTKRSVGVALDIGTTTVVGSTVDIGGRGGAGGAGGAGGSRVLDTVALPNPQSKWGPDLISRVNAAVADPGAVEEMRASIIEACNVIIRELTGKGVATVVEVAAAGNSVMEHLFLGVSPEPFSRVPYRPAFKEARTIGAGGLGLEAAPDCAVYLFPLIGGFVGGDTVAVMLSLGLHEAGGAGGGGGGGGVELAIDIGTNSEIVLRAGRAVYATSAAAGPAFEGGELSCGMTANRGAISGVTVTDDGLTLDVVGGVAPRGICGSGLIDAASGLLRAGVIERSGRIKGPEEVSTNLSVKITGGGGAGGAGSNAFVLYRGSSGVVSLTQGDIRALQTAKAAIRAGVSVLMRKAGVGPRDVEKVHLAGAFGSNIDKGSLAEIGVLDREWLPVTDFSGDAALDGVVTVLGSGERKREAERIAVDATYLSLSGSALFEGEFIANIDF